MNIVADNKQYMKETIYMKDMKDYGKAIWKTIYIWRKEGNKRMALARREKARKRKAEESKLQPVTLTIIAENNMKIYEKENGRK